MEVVPQDGPRVLDALAAVEAVFDLIEIDRDLAPVLRDEFVLAFQPQMSLVTGEVAGAEALLRWNHPRDGLRLPGTFIPVAERTGLVAEIGEWVIDEVASTLAQWQRDGFDGDSNSWE